MQAEKRIHGAPNLHCSSYISKIVWWLPMFDFGIFCHLLRLMGCIRWGPCLGIWKVSFSLFFSSCSFFFFLSFLSFIFYFSLSLSGAPYSSGPLDIVHPCHPVATPLLHIIERYNSLWIQSVINNERCLWPWGYYAAPIRVCGTAKYIAPGHAKRKLTWRPRIWWLAKLAWYDVTWNPLYRETMKTVFRKLMDQSVKWLALVSGWQI